MSTNNRYTISVKHDWKIYRYTVEHIPVDQRKEQFKLIAQNKTLLIESNRPLFRNKNLKHRRYELKIVQGDIANMAFQNLIFEQLEALAEKFLGKP